MTHRFGGWAIASGCIVSGLCCYCPKGDRGLQRGDIVQTTILSNDLGSRRRVLVGDTPGSPLASCGDLGDLPAGAVLTSVASLGAGGGEACDSGVILTPQTLTTVTFTSSGPGTGTIRLPNGCTGRFDVSFGSLDGSSSFLDNNKDGGVPTWWLVRRFQPTAAASLCFPTATTTVPACADAFVAENVRK